MRDRVWVAEKRAALLRDRGVRIPATRQHTSPARKPLKSPAVHGKARDIPPAPDGRVMCRVLAAPADGRCFYHSLAHVFGTTTEQIMKTMLSFASRHPTPTRSRAIARINNGEWATHEEVLTAAAAFDSHILVYETANRTWISFGDDSSLFTAYLLNSSNIHFEPFVPCPSGCDY